MRSQKSPRFVASTQEWLVGQCLHGALTCALTWQTLRNWVPIGRWNSGLRPAEYRPLQASSTDVGAASVVRWIPSLGALIPHLKLPVGEESVHLPAGSLAFSVHKQGIPEAHTDGLRTYQPLTAAAPMAALQGESSIYKTTQQWFASAYASLFGARPTPEALPRTVTPPRQEAAATPAGATFPEIMQEVLRDTRLSAKSPVKAGATMVRNLLPWAMSMTVPDATELASVAHVTNDNDPKMSHWTFTLSKPLSLRIEPTRSFLGWAFGWLAKCFRASIGSAYVGKDGILTVNGKCYIFGLPLKFAMPISKKRAQLNTDVQQMFAGEFLKMSPDVDADPSAAVNPFKLLQEHLGTVEVDVKPLRYNSLKPSYTLAVPEELQEQLGQSLQVSRNAVKVAIDFDAPDEREATTVYGILHVRAHQTGPALWRSSHGLMEKRATTLELTTSVALDDDWQTMVVGNLRAHMQPKDPSKKPLLFDVSANYTSAASLLELKASYKLGRDEHVAGAGSTNPSSRPESPDSTPAAADAHSFASAALRLQNPPILEMLHIDVNRPVKAFGLAMPQLQVAYMRTQPEDDE